MRNYARSLRHGMAAWRVLRARGMAVCLGMTICVWCCFEHVAPHVQHAVPLRASLGAKPYVRPLTKSGSTYASSCFVYFVYFV